MPLSRWYNATLGEKLRACLENNDFVNKTMTNLAVIIELKRYPFFLADPVDEVPSSNFLSATPPQEISFEFLIMPLYFLRGRINSNSLACAEPRSRRFNLKDTSVP